MTIRLCRNAVGVMAVKDSLYIVETEYTLYNRACQAVSCLVKPEKDDLVLVCRVGPEDAYILAVLARENPGRTHLEFRDRCGHQGPAGAKCGWRLRMV